MTEEKRYRLYTGSSMIKCNLLIVENSLQSLPLNVIHFTSIRFILTTLSISL